MIRQQIIAAAMVMTFLPVGAQNTEQRTGLLKNLEYKAELQATISNDKTPLWLNANRYGLSSLDDVNGYVRGGVARPLSRDSAFRWGLGYGLDVAVAHGFTSRAVVQQAYVEGRWLHGVLTVGSKEYPMELKNNSLSSGSQTLGINARPVPQVRMALPEYWTVPLTRGWLHLKGHVAFGRMTDDNWQHEFTNRQSKYADNVLYHSKAGYLKIGNEDRFCPWSLEMGLEMASTFGGTAYQMNSDGEMESIKNSSGIKSFWQAFMPGGAEATEGKYQNAEGNQLGSWLIRINYKGNDYGVSVYADKFFEDHSAMFQLDYNGYGTGSEWNVKKERRYMLYDFKDMMLGAEVNIYGGRWLRNIVFEYLYTKYQSGPVYHDHTESLSEHVGGNDDFYNHSIFTGWQHWGQVIGNPLYCSPIYNNDGKIIVTNNRFMAFHIGVDGCINDNLEYRLLGTWQDGFGTYSKPYTSKRYNTSVMIELSYVFPEKVSMRGWGIKGGYAMDFGRIRGNNNGFQLTISKKGLLL